MYKCDIILHKLLRVRKSIPNKLTDRDDHSYTLSHKNGADWSLKQCSQHCSLITAQSLNHPMAPYESGRFVGRTISVQTSLYKQADAPGRQTMSRASVADREPAAIRLLRRSQSDWLVMVN